MMAHSEITASLKPRYETDIDNVIEELYKPCLQNSNRYVRATGFFKTSIFRLMTEDILDFAIHGGKITIITSIFLSEDDYRAAMEGHAVDFTTRTLEEMALNPKTVKPLEMLSCLIHNGNLELNIGLRKKGMYHRKEGYFVDKNGHKISFSGSGNETRTAVDPEIDSGSSEAFNVFWESKLGDSWQDYGRPIISRLDKEMKNEIPGTPVISVREIDEKIFNFFDEDWLEYEAHRKLSKRRQKLINDKWIEYSGKKRRENILKHSGVKKLIPDLYPHQSTVLENWETKKFRGIVEHCTGSGKTITALSAIDKHSAEGFPTIIIAPSKLLIDQWEKEISEKLPEHQLLIVDGRSKNKNWPRYIGNSLQNSNPPNIILASLKTVGGELNKSSKFTNFLIRYESLKKLENCLFVVDECHTLGQKTLSDFCGLKSGKRLGLSATWRRWMDDEGTHRIQDFLGDPLHPVYGISDALNDNPPRLTPYYYSIEETVLTDNEQDEYNEIRDQINQALRKAKRDKSGNIIWGDGNEWLQKLYRDAASVIKKAENKVEKTAEILLDPESGFEIGQHWLVYCEDGTQLDKVKSKLIDSNLGPHLREYRTATDYSLIGTLNDFKNNGGILLSIRCLDEGVDIREISHAIILASTQNPRQYIQRRGRVLRLHENKYRAKIWDCLVVPRGEIGEEADYIFSELNRAEEFAITAENNSTLVRIKLLKEMFGMNSAVVGDYQEDILDD